MPTSTRRVTPPQSRREELLAIAARLFATKGYVQTTVRDIADEAGILSGSLYHHFVSKETMLEEILREFMTTLNVRFSEIAGSDDPPRAKLDALIAYSFLTIHESPYAVALYQNESATIADLPAFEFVTDATRSNEALWQQVISAGQRSGDFRSDLNASVTYRFIRDAVWSTVRWYSPRGRSKHDVLTEQFLTLLHTGLLA